MYASVAHVGVLGPPASSAGFPPGVCDHCYRSGFRVCVHRYAPLAISYGRNRNHARGVQPDVLPPVIPTPEPSAWTPTRGPHTRSSPVALRPSFAALRLYWSACGGARIAETGSDVAGGASWCECMGRGRGGAAILAVEEDMENICVVCMAGPR